MHGIAPTAGTSMRSGWRRSELAQAGAKATDPVTPAAVPQTSVPQTSAPEGSDPVLRAMHDEMMRSFTGLHSAGENGKPFFIGYTVNQTDEVELVASLGSITSDTAYSGRMICPDVRVGNYDLNNTNYAGATATPSAVRDRLTIDDDYDNVRRGAWMSTDKAYGLVLKDLESKKAWLKSNYMKDRLPDTTREKPVIHVEDVGNGDLHFDEKKWTEIVKKLSAIYKTFPLIEMSKVSVLVRRDTRWLENTEGSCIRDSHDECYFVTEAWTEAKDGMDVRDYDIIATDSADKLPSYEVLEKKVRELAQRCTEIREAQLSEDYIGPILFEDHAAAEFFSQLLACNLGFAHERTGNFAGTYTNPFKNAIGRRILPKFISVIDDPLTTEFNGQTLIGGWKLDYDGVPAQKITLVDHGAIKAFCSSRLPTKGQEHSNGHSVLGLGTNSVLWIVAHKTETKDELRKHLIELGKESGLDYVLVVKHLNSAHSTVEYPSPWAPQSVSEIDTPSHSVMLTDPSWIYRVYVNDGHEELVRGAKCKYATMRVLKDIDGVGDDAAPYVVQRDGRKPIHIIAPSVLVREFELDKDDTKNERPPIMSSPLSESQ